MCEKLIWTYSHHFWPLSSKLSDRYIPKGRSVFKTVCRFEISVMYLLYIHVKNVNKAWYTWLEKMYDWFRTYVTIFVYRRSRHSSLHEFIIPDCRGLFSGQDSSKNSWSELWRAYVTVSFENTLDITRFKF